MKKIISFCAVFFILFSVFMPVVNCADSIVTENVTAQKNRLFDVNVAVDSDKIISAATFIIKYDSSKLAWREGKTELSNSLVKYRNKDNQVKLIFLCADGIALDKSKTLFSVKFKALDYGESKISISASDCVSNNLKNIEEFKGTSSCVSVKSQNGISSSGYQKGNSVEKQEKSSVSTETSNAVLTQKSNKRISITDADNQGLTIALCCAFALVIILAGYLVKLYRDRFKNRKKKK